MSVNRQKNDSMRTEISQPCDEFGYVGQGRILGVSQTVCTDRPVSTGQSSQAADGRNERLKALAIAYGDARLVYGNQSPKDAAWTAFVNELERVQ